MHVKTYLFYFRGGVIPPFSSDGCTVPVACTVGELEELYLVQPEILTIYMEICINKYETQVQLYFDFSLENLTFP